MQTKLGCSELNTLGRCFGEHVKLEEFVSARLCVSERVDGQICCKEVNMFQNCLRFLLHLINRLDNNVNKLIFGEAHGCCMQIMSNRLEKSLANPILKNMEKLSVI